MPNNDQNLFFVISVVEFVNLSGPATFNQKSFHRNYKLLAFERILVKGSSGSAVDGALNFKEL
jgi:hypothetical protein